MKNRYFLFFIFCISTMAVLTSCVKKVDVLQTNFLTINLNSSGSKAVTSDLTVNPKDSIFFDFSISSTKNMKYVYIQKNGTEISRDTLNSSNQTSFSTIKKFAADSATGPYTYRILARDSAGIILGDKNVVVTVTSDFIYYTVQKLMVPDSTAKTNTAFFATTTGKTFSYTTAASNTGLIDFGYYYDTAAANKHTIYALNQTQTQLNFYDFSAWTKNATIFKKITTPTFVNITSSAILQSTGVAQMSSGTASKATLLVTGNTVLFKTAAGKYGAIQVIYTNADSPAAGTYMTVDVKVQK